MASDLKIDIDGVRLNVRVGAIMRYNDDVIVEVSTVGRNSVIPGGRIKINEKSTRSLVRELKEEMNFDVDESRLTQKSVFENFFTYEQKDFHELYFVYEYQLNDDEYKVLSNLSTNKDNSTTYFKFVSKNELEKYNVLPVELYDLIRN